MIRRPPRSTRTDTLFPYTTRFRSHGAGRDRRWRSRGAAACAAVPQLRQRRAVIDDRTPAGHPRYGRPAGADDQASGRLAVHRALGELGEEHVGLLLLLQGLVKQLGGLVHAELLRPRLEGAVAGDPVMLDGLGSGDQPGVEHLAALEVVHDLLAFLDDPLDRSEERRVGKECVSTCRSRWSPYH